MRLLTCYIWKEQAFSKRLYIIWEVLYSITGIPWIFVLVNINFHVIQFLLMSVFLHNEMKTYLPDISLFLLFAKTIPQKVLKYLKVIGRYFIAWAILLFIIGRNFIGKNFSTGKNEEISEKTSSLFPDSIFPN